jgi:hypothetical protein
VPYLRRAVMWFVVVTRAAKCGTLDVFVRGRETRGPSPQKLSSAGGGAGRRRGLANLTTGSSGVALHKKEEQRGVIEVNNSQ